MLVTISFPPNGAINTLIAEKYARFYKNRAKSVDGKVDFRQSGFEKGAFGRNAPGT